MKLKTVLTINLVLFCIIGLLHLSRLIWQWEVSLAGWKVPLWINGMFVVVAAAVVWLNWKQRENYKL